MIIEGIDRLLESKIYKESEISIDDVKYMIKSGKNQRMLLRVAFAGDLNLLKWAKENKCGIDWEVSCCAAMGGNLHVLGWLKDNGYRISRRVVNYAIVCGHLDIVKWMVGRNGYQIEGIDIGRAMMKDRLDITNYLREKAIEQLI